jgi:hypothetical protein
MAHGAAAVVGQGDGIEGQVDSRSRRRQDAQVYAWPLPLAAAPMRDEEAMAGRSATPAGVMRPEMVR